ncbi:MAG TPA: phosphate--AMP phosphotransferase [Pseudobacteroides sp.]|uniref:phosphate--AMP phosphotransferase n=1 Tax=Pseudobacteroides sp. TaxID=1968840 RepID=UPI002F945894
MIKKFDFHKFKSPYEKMKRAELGERLAKLQRLVKNKKIPVLIIIDGWESSGKGFVLNDLIRELDPRSYKVSVFDKPTDEENERSFLWRFWSKVPKKGDMAIFDRSFYFDIMNKISIEADELKRDIRDISTIEKQLHDDNTIIIKYFLHVKEKTQKERIDELTNHKYSELLVTDRDIQQNQNYKNYCKHFDNILKLSSFRYSPWNIISGEDLKNASKTILGMTIDLIQEGMERLEAKDNNNEGYIRGHDAKVKPLENVDLSLTIKQDYYESKLKKLQKEAQKIAYKMYAKGIPGIIVFEGMDASGKGGAIQRLTGFMDPRGYYVVPTSAPNETEKQHHYLWRFYRDHPAKGNIAIFDRSWYGRVLVERVEGFAKINEWVRAYEEINQMEKHLHNFGTFVLKFFIYIDKDEQLKRFRDRENEPDKEYKITDEDWRNRKKWDSYIEAMNEMLVRTDTDYAPWIIIEGQDKKYARIKVLQEFIKHAKNHFKI